MVEKPSKVEVKPSVTQQYAEVIVGPVQVVCSSVAVTAKDNLSFTKDNEVFAQVEIDGSPWEVPRHVNRAIRENEHNTWKAEERNK